MPDRDTSWGGRSDQNRTQNREHEERDSNRQRPEEQRAFGEQGQGGYRNFEREQGEGQRQGGGSSYGDAGRGQPGGACGSYGQGGFDRGQGSPGGTTSYGQLSQGVSDRPGGGMYGDNVGGYGQRGFEGQGGQGGGTYGQSDVSPSAQRSRWNQDQHASGRQGYYGDSADRDHDDDHDPAYRRQWREHQLSSHDARFKDREDEGRDDKADSRRD